MAEYQRGTGPNALPQGGATALNAAQPTFGDPMFDAPEIPVQFAPGDGDVDVSDTGGAGEDLQVLLDAPDPDFQPPLVNGTRPGRVPTYVVRHLPELLAAARDPTAPPTLIALKNAALRHLEDEMRRGG